MSEQKDPKTIIGYISTIPKKGFIYIISLYFSFSSKVNVNQLTKTILQLKPGSDQIKKMFLATLDVYIQMKIGRKF